MAGLTSFGTLLKMDDSSNSGVYTTVANLGDIDGPELAANTEDVTTHDSTGGYDEVMPDGVLSLGEISFEINYDPAGGTHDNTTGLISCWRTKHKRRWKLIFPDTTEWIFYGYVSKITPKAPVRGVLKADVTIKPTGSPTLA